MTEPDILREEQWRDVQDRFPIGTLIEGIVSEWQFLDMAYRSPGYEVGTPDILMVEVELPFAASILGWGFTDHLTDLSPEAYPRVGESIQAVICNYHDYHIYLSARPHDLVPESIQRWRQWHELLRTIHIGQVVTGTVTHVMHFGLFLELGLGFIGLIDIVGHTHYPGQYLPRNPDHWPKVGDSLRCMIRYYQGHEIGLSWMKDEG
jgi:hypothetical protein